MSAPLLRVVRAATGDDGTGGWWKRLAPDGRAALRLAFVEVRELGHPCLGAEHVLLGVLRHGTSGAAALVRDHGLDLGSARGELLRVGPSLRPAVEPADALAGMGIEIDQVRRRLVACFGSEAVRAAEWRVRRRPRWRGGHARPMARLRWTPGRPNPLRLMLEARGVDLTALLADLTPRGGGRAPRRRGESASS